MIYLDIGTFKSKIEAPITPYTVYELYTGTVFTKHFPAIIHNSQSQLLYKQDMYI